MCWRNPRGGTSTSTYGIASPTPKSIPRATAQLGFHASAANGARQRPILPHQHPRALVTRNRPVGVYDRGQSAALTRPAHPDDLFEQIHRAFPPARGVLDFALCRVLGCVWLRYAAPVSPSIRPIWTPCFAIVKMHPCGPSGSLPGLRVQFPDPKYCFYWFCCFF